MSVEKIESTFAEAFEMRFCRLLVTAIDDDWLDIATSEFCGYGTSVIGCDAEVGVEQRVSNRETPDGRVGATVLAFAFSQKDLSHAVVSRVGQCLMTCPTTAVFNGLDAPEMIPLGSSLRFFGDGYQKSKLLGARRFWRIPVMDGEFIVEQSLGVDRGIGGGNFIIQTRDQIGGLSAAKSAVGAIQKLPGCITPFPGGIARSGSKVGSRYKNLVASTAETFCPTLVARVESQLHPDARCGYEIVIDGVDQSTIENAMRAGIQAALDCRSADQIVRISAGNYGGKLGKFLIPLMSLFEDLR